MGPKKKNKKGWTRKPMHIASSKTVNGSGPKPTAGGGAESLQSMTSNIKAFDSLRNLVMCEAGMDNTYTIGTSNKKASIIQEPPADPGGSEEQPSENHINTENANGLMCKIINPRQIELNAFIKTELEYSPDISADEGSHTDIPETPAIADKTVNTNNPESDDSTADANFNKFPLSEATLQEVLDCKEVNDMILENHLQEDGTLTFDSLRQLADNYLAVNVKERQAKKISKRKRICDECGFKSKTFYDLLKHMKYKHGPSIYSCPVKGCNFTTKYPGNISHHQTIHTQVRPHTCPTCPKRFKRKSQLATHLTTHSDERPFACNKCDFRTKRNWILTTHMTQKHSDERPFGCEICGFRTKTRNDMNKHKRIHTEGKKFVCQDCDKAFTHKTRLVVHRKNMHGNIIFLPCPEKDCLQNFKSNRRMQKHIDIIHKGIKMFKCNICDRTYGSKGGLGTHMITHDPTERPFKCPICPFQGKEDAFVRLHMQKVHKHALPYSCDLCHVRFKVQRRLQQHLKTDTHRRNCKFTLPPQDAEVKPHVGALYVSLQEDSLPSGKQVTIKQEPTDH